MKEYELALDFENATYYANDILNRLDNLNLINGRFVTVICAFVEDLEPADFEGVDWQVEIENLVGIVETIVALLEGTGLTTGKKVFEFIDSLSDVEGLINNTAVLNNTNLHLIVDLLDQIFNELKGEKLK